MDEQKTKEQKVVEKTNIKRVGKITFAVTMILLGITLLLQMILDFGIFKYVLMAWPVIFVMLGAETIYYSLKKQVEIKYDIKAMLMTFFVLIIATIFSTAGFVLNKVLFDEEIKSLIIEENIPQNQTYFFENEVKINNLTDKTITLNITENKEYENTIVNVRLAYNKEKIHKKSYINLGKYSSIFNRGFENDLTLANFPDWLNYIQINVVTNNKENIKYIGNINVM